MIKMIAAVSKNGIIGCDNDIPWKGKYPEDFKFFRQMTTGGAIIMGRKTWESIGKVLPKRRNIVISRNKVEVEGLETYSSLENAIEGNSITRTNDPPIPPPDVWLIGGASIYKEGMAHASEIYLTLIPETVTGEGLVHFPWVDPTKFVVTETMALEGSELKVLKYTRV